MRAGAALIYLGFGASCVGAGLLVALAPPTVVPGIVAAFMIAMLWLGLRHLGRAQSFDLFSPPVIVLGLIAAQVPVQVLYEVLVSHANSVDVSSDHWARLLLIALGLSALGMLSFVASYSLAGSRVSAALVRAPKLVPSRDWTRSRVHTVVVVFSLLGLMCYWKFMSDAGGLAYVLRNLQARISLSAGRHDLLAGVQLLPLASIIWQAFLARSNHVQGRARLVWRLHAVLSSAVLLSLGGRSALVSYWVALIVVRHYGTRKFGSRFVMAFALVAVVFIAMAGWYRASTADSATAPKFTPSRVFSPRAIANEVLNYDISPLDVFILEIEKIPSQVSYRYGGSLLETVYQPIPRSFMHHKPAVLTAWYKSELLNRTDGGGIRSSALGEGYVNFGVVGVVLLMALYGVMGKAFYSRLRKSAAPDCFALVFYAIAVQYLIQVSIGTFDEATVIFVERLLPFAVVAGYIRAPQMMRRPTAIQAPFSSRA